MFDWESVGALVFFTLLIAARLLLLLPKSSPSVTTPTEHADAPNAEVEPDVLTFGVQVLLDAHVALVASLTETIAVYEDLPRGIAVVNGVVVVSTAQRSEDDRRLPADVQRENIVNDVERGEGIALRDLVDTPYRSSRFRVMFPREFAAWRASLHPNRS